VHDGRLYWAQADRSDEDGPPGAIGRANLDGSGVQADFITGVDPFSGLVVTDRFIFWSESEGETIGRANLDGTGINRSFLTPENRPSALAADARHVYWSNSRSEIGRATVTGTDVNEDLVPGVDVVLSGALAVDAGFDPPPVVGRSVEVAVVRGVVLVRRRGQRQFVRLRGDALIPTGSEIDTRRGSVRLTSAAGGAATETAEFFSGRFVVRQRPARRPVTELVLSEPLTCPRGTRARAAARRRGLWGRGRGRFVTRGRHAAATVRGTTWLTRDTCTTTTVSVREGSVSVRDFVRRRTVLVRAGRSYTARARR
jgi:hypothetical protein